MKKTKQKLLVDELLAKRNFLEASDALAELLVMQQRSSLIPAESKALPQAEDEAVAQAELFALKQRSSEIPSESRAFSQADDEKLSKQQLLLDAFVAEQNYKGAAVAKADLLALKQRSAVITAESRALSQADVETISTQ